MTCGFLVIDKPPGLTSHDVVAVIRSTTGIRKVGHTGTLDPFATGVLPLALGRATRLIQYLHEDHKVYDATIQLGRSTDTGDLTGQVVEEIPIPDIDAQLIPEVLAGFEGEQMQAPPRYSAVKVKGRRLYSYARAGEEVEIAKRPIRIDRIQLIEHTASRLRVRIDCGRGTYARVLGEDIARALGTAGHLVSLRRLQSGCFEESNALPMPALSDIVAGVDDWQRALRPARGAERVQWKPRDQVLESLSSRVMSPNTALGHLPEIEVPASQLASLVNSGQLRGVRTAFPDGTQFRACRAGALVALMVQEGAGPRVLRMVATREEVA